ncbi:hypothetical protein B0J11DRAFT_142392 [Dendryphion nanum]|uniref:LIM zinc-binding domain-containing protein n=1 Tax=Dendryphion nanum TaxID=256645 RepID=A0A9P9D5C8_9PLEO|nr:hypothetical protein B0J11DRAFT_142392 [Dendryphion nanum]
MADGLKIKCSTCAVDIDISELADHICPASPTSNNAPVSPILARAATFDSYPSNPLPSASPPSNYAPYTASNTSPYSASYDAPSTSPYSEPYNAPPQSRSGRTRPPARIDSAAANKPFMPQNNQLTPGSSYSNNQTLSPLTSDYGRSRPKVMRSATSPVPRLAASPAPPSPEFQTNMDSAFPPFPTSRPGKPPHVSRSRSKPEQPTYNHQYAPASPLFAPLSPRPNGGENILKRMDNIAPGPFDGSDRRPSTSDGRNASGSRPVEFGHKRTATQGSSRSFGAAPNQRTSMSSTVSQTSTFSNRSVGLPARPRIGAGGMPLPLPRAPPKPEDDSEGIDAFLNRLRNETAQSSRVGQDSRPRASPPRQENKPFVAALESRPPVINSYGNDANSSMRIDTQPLLAPRTYGKDLPANPLHTPSDSGLSDDSYSSTGTGFRSIASSRSSPPASESSGQHSRNVSKMGRSDYITEEPIQRVDSPESFLDPRTPPKPMRRGEPVGPDRAMVPEPPTQFNARPMYDALESPMDPAIQRGLSFDKRPAQSQKPFSNDPALNLGISPPQRPYELESRARSDRRPPTASRGKCKGCTKPIVGKSVKDSSGRLTGRYHKQCFTCRTCGDPFPTADFYVFQNYPYCEQHYHELNNSLCQLCNRGIEGQYLETDTRRKYHPRCFTCQTCRVVLRDDYYEVDDRTYCERHVYAAARGGPALAPGYNGSRNIEKRRTRLMMM